ncbi:hypothetical protein PMAYCL1PPCAC_02224, partial [Pristionchus mayeri]
PSTMIALLLLNILHLIYSQSVCIQFIEKCGQTVVEEEKLLIQHRTRAFSQCVTSPMCANERIIFDECFMDSFLARSGIKAASQFSQTFAD